MKQVLICVGARPNLMKASSLFRVASSFPDIKLHLLHTGQHYSQEMDKVFFDEFQIPNPDYQLNVGSASHAVQTADIMKKFETLLLEKKFNLIIVIGDVNSTLACALVASKLHVPVAHVEAGLRSFDMSMPEEVNRKIADHLSDYLFTTEPSGEKNLANEGISPEKIFFVGNTMIDTLIHHLKDIQAQKPLEHFHLGPREYAVLTLHRPSNVDSMADLKILLEDIANNLPKQQPIVFPVHPRTRKVLSEIPHSTLERFRIVDPLPYFSFLSLVYHSSCVLTDSGGIQEETTYLKIPCFTLRPNTERPITTEIGSNFLINRDLSSISSKLAEFNKEDVRIPDLWDGGTGKRILDIISKLDL